MRVSLILTSFNRINDLRRFLDSLSRRSTLSPGVQLVFINQGQYLPRPEFSFLESISYSEIATGKLPLSHARNIGLKHVTGEVIGFPDDDCWYAPDLLEQVARYFGDHPATDAICTNVYDPVVQRSYGGRPVGTHARVDFHNLFELPISVGIFVRRPAFEAAGFHFDELLGAGTRLGSGEETDLIYRLLKRGALVEYVGSIQVFHPVPEYQDTDVEKYYRYGLGFGYLNGRIVRDGERRVLRHLGYVLMRSLGGSMMNIHRSTQRRLYWNRLLGVCHGFARGFRGTPC